MFKLKSRPYNLLLIATIILLCASLLVLNETLDIHLHDTYYIIPTAYAFWGIVLFLILLWVVYMVTNRWLFSKSLVWLHVIISIAASLFIVIYLLNFRGMAGMPRRYVDFSEWDMFRRYRTSIVVSVMVLAGGVVVYLVNLVVGLVRRRL